MIGTIGHHKASSTSAPRSRTQPRLGVLPRLRDDRVACLIHLAGWRWMIRFLSILFWIVTGGMLLAVASLLFTGK